MSQAANLTNGVPQFAPFATADVAALLKALTTTHSGASRPVVIQGEAEGLWIGKVSGTEWDLLYYDGNSDILIGSFNPTSHTWSAAVPAIAGQFGLTGVISPAQITADQNDYNPPSLASSAVMRLSSDVSRNLTGLQGGSSGRIIIIHNVGAQNLVFKNENLSSAAGNRFDIGADVTLAASSVIMLQYDGTSTRWRALYSSTGAAPGGALLAANNLSDVNNVATSRHSLGLDTVDSPQFTGVNVGNASDTTITRSGAGIIAVAGSTVPLNTISSVHVAGTIELGNAADTTLSRASAGNINIEGNLVYRAGGTKVPVADGGTGAGDAPTARTNLGVAIGTNVEAWNANLDTLSSGSVGNWKVVYTNGSAAMQTLTVGAVGTALCGNGVTAAPTWQGVALLAGNQTFTAGGFVATSFAGGTITGAGQTYTPSASNGQFQHVTLNGSSLTGTLTWAVPAVGVTQVIVEVTNGGSGAVAATLSTAGYDHTDGTWVATNGAKFLFISTRSQNYKHLQIVPLQ